MFSLEKTAKIIQDVKKKERNKSKQKTIFRRKLVYIKRCGLFFPLPAKPKPTNQLIEEAARDEFTNICIASQINE